MSASLYWTPTGNGKLIDAESPNALIEALDAAFGRRSDGWTLGQADAPVVRGIGAGNPSLRPITADLLDAIREHGEIRVWARW